MSIVTCRTHQSHDVQNYKTAKFSHSVFHFVGGETGSWRIKSTVARMGVNLPQATHVQILPGEQRTRPHGRAAWTLPCVARNTRFVTRDESHIQSTETSAGESCAALIITRKSPVWWKLAREKRHEILATPIGGTRNKTSLLRGMIRRFQQNYDRLQDFDVVTWIEYSSQDAEIFDELSRSIRYTEEWRYVERDIVIKLARC